MPRFPRRLLLCALLLSAPAQSAGPDHARWDALLQACVRALDGGSATAVDYRCMADRRDALLDYLAALGRIAPAEYATWSGARQLAFLINAYNAGTVELILRHYPGLDSIRDIGGLLRSPWKRRFVSLLGEARSLDDIEHDMIRAPGAFDEPRIHFAVNCASIGCPALRREAYRHDRLDDQLEDQTRRFLGDRTRNRLRSGRLEISPLFKWYRDDFATDGPDAPAAPRGFLLRYAESLGLDADRRRDLRSGALGMVYLEYDWRLNDLPG